MSNNPKDSRVAFAYGPSPSGPVLIFAIPRLAWEHMKDGDTHQFDLTKVGIPMKVVLFGAENYQAAMDLLAIGAQITNTPLRRITDIDLSFESPPEAPPT